MRDDLERLLADEEKIVPSSGFMASVMQAVEREAAAPPPLPFPWLRALPGLLAMIAIWALAAWQGSSVLSDPVEIEVFAGQMRQVTTFAVSIGLHWILLSVVITVVSMTLPLGFVRGRVSV